MHEYIKDFIESNIKYIDLNKFETLYMKCDDAFRPVLTYVLMKAGVDPLNHVKTVPISYMYGYNGLKEIVIPENVINISDNSFTSMQHLERINIGANVQTLGFGVLALCVKLKYVTLNDMLTVIPKLTFFGCISLETVKLPASLTTIGESAFAKCTNLTTIDIPENVTKISDKAFTGCENLKSVHVPTSVIRIFPRAFEGCSNLTIYYDGTKEDWKHISEATTRYNIPVICSDGRF